VPATFREQYEYGVRPAGGFDSTSRQRSEYERIVCEGTYSNYRRFETRVRIK
jgi:hypothetical protein